MKFIVEPHQHKAEPKEGMIVAFWSKSAPGMPYIGTILEIDDTGIEPYYVIETNDSTHLGCFEVAVLSSWADINPSSEPF